MMNITITINHEAHSVIAGTNLQQVIEQFDLPNLGCVFAINNQVVPKSNWHTTKLNQGDVVSLFQAIAGG